MATFVAPVSNTTERKSLPPGSYLGRCYQMILLGTHKEEFQGVEKNVQKIRLGWEFPDELDVFSAEKGQEPYVMGREFTFSMHEKATFRGTLEQWRGKKFTDEEAAVFDAGKLLGAACLINVVAYQKKDGTTGVKIGSVSPLMKGMLCPPQINPTQALTFEDFDYTVYDKLPGFIREKIALSPEWAVLRGNVEPLTQTAFVNAPEPEGELEPLPF